MMYMNCIHITYIMVCTLYMCTRYQRYIYYRHMLCIHYTQYVCVIYLPYSLLPMPLNFHVCLFSCVLLDAAFCFLRSPHFIPWFGEFKFSLNFLVKTKAEPF